MKRFLSALIVFVLLLSLASCALSEELVFTRRNFYGGQTLPVYNGPGHEYGRGSNGYAKADTDEPLYAAGKENGWALVMYETGDGSVRVGYVDLGQFHYNTNILKLDQLNFSYSSAKIAQTCTLTDDPVLNNRDLTLLSKDLTVTYLASFYKHRNWAYIETWVDGRPIRGFVPMDCISW